MPSSNSCFTWITKVLTFKTEHKTDKESLLICMQSMCCPRRTDTHTGAHVLSNLF